MKSSFHILIVMAVITLSGCALQKDLYSLETRQSQLERRTLRMEEQVGKSVQSRIEKIMNDKQGEAKQLRTQFARIRADFDRMQDEVNRLKSSVEEARFKDSKEEGREEESAPKDAEKIVMLTRELEQTKRRLAQLELYLDMEKPDDGEEGVADTGDMTADKAMYAAAKTHYDQGRMAEARKGFKAFLEAYPKSSVADNAQFWIGETLYQQKDYDRAILEYQKVIENYPKENKVPAAMLKQAFAFQKIKDLDIAKQILKELSQKYPSSNEGKIAAQKLKDL